MKKIVGALVAAIMLILLALPVNGMINNNISAPHGNDVIVGSGSSVSISTSSAKNNSSPDAVSGENSEDSIIHPELVGESAAFPSNINYTISPELVNEGVGITFIGIAEDIPGLEINDRVILIRADVKGKTTDGDNAKTTVKQVLANIHYKPADSNDWEEIPYKPVLAIGEKTIIDLRDYIPRSAQNGNFKIELQKYSETATILSEGNRWIIVVVAVAFVVAVAVLVVRKRK